MAHPYILSRIKNKLCVRGASATANIPGNHASGIHARSGRTRDSVAKIQHRRIPTCELAARRATAPVERAVVTLLIFPVPIGRLCNAITTNTARYAHVFAACQRTGAVGVPIRTCFWGREWHTGVVR
ncbi:hypothetical protein A3C37_02550 [Candidatus Peribacteria bacterium RIFCSPHIGHO2_02_FULL_53_20]|nr:MAG: hypothetical protein A3C37_02550 [Candidatus Peribacteria bacterium RIFCSPHIGHO2_02_FULL_53_20]OGJ67787.1 MAG: hypothetical protein A3B61_03430 [Candidatus Peribacteria bacterium RIFCSPLOWO2_01_FULL_53_10]OGJ69520.1 MAG: hypothetical protein A3G69_02255 [Candidatus Peribacteria bacterium RIFCSPLOWO2_12_FULL_53_10]